MTRKQPEWEKDFDNLWKAKELNDYLNGHKRLEIKSYISSLLANQKKKIKAKYGEMTLTEAIDEVVLSEKQIENRILKAKRKLLKRILKHGRGGGNWRRLILQELEAIRSN